MIDNFEKLVARCENARRRQMIRLSFMIVGSVLFVIAGVSGYQMWNEYRIPPKAVVEKVAPKPSQETNISLSPALQEANQTFPSTAVPVKTASASPAAVAAPLPKPAVAATPLQTSAIAPAPLSPAASAPKGNRLFDVNTRVAENPVEAYKNNPSYENALAAARNFYAQENFADAAIWAKKANQLNREAEEAWLLYAKSYYSQGRKNEAIGILELYLNYKDSKAAFELIRTWKSAPTN